MLSPPPLKVGNSRRIRQGGCKMNKEELKNIVECLLFVSDSPVEVERLTEVTGVNDQNTVLSAIRSLKKDYEARKSSLQISAIAGGYQMSTRREFGEWIKKLFKKQVTYLLSHSALETLSVIAYKQPITRAEIENIRGVDISGVLRSMLDKKLIKTAGKKDCIGRPTLYRTTDYFLKYFGLKDISDMPDVQELEK